MLTLNYRNRIHLSTYTSAKMGLIRYLNVHMLSPYLFHIEYSETALIWPPLGPKLLALIMRLEEQC